MKLRPKFLIASQAPSVSAAIMPANRITTRMAAACVMRRKRASPAPLRLTALILESETLVVVFKATSAICTPDPVLGGSDTRRIVP